MMSSKDAEQQLAKIRKLSANRECVNCGEVSRLGFGAICVKFKTFVCNHCKSSHQAYSHRVKSVTMSTWTTEEVEVLRKKNGGGNEVAKAKWFSSCSEKDLERFRPKPGDHLDKYKQFIVMVYEEKRWYDENATVNVSETKKEKRSKSRSNQAHASSAIAGQNSNAEVLKAPEKPIENMFGSLTIKANPSQTSIGEAEADLLGGSPNESVLTHASSAPSDEIDLLGSFSQAATSSAAPGSGSSPLSALSPLEEFGSFNSISAGQVANVSNAVKPTAPDNDPFAVLQPSASPALSGQTFSPAPPAPMNGLSSSASGMSGVSYPASMQPPSAMPPVQVGFQPQVNRAAMPPAPSGIQLDPFAVLHAPQPSPTPLGNQTSYTRTGMMASHPPPGSTLPPQTSMPSGTGMRPQQSSQVPPQAFNFHGSGRPSHPSSTTPANMILHNLAPICSSDDPFAGLQ